MAEYILEGLESILGNLDQFEAIVKPELDQAAAASLISMIRPLATYPPARKYRRTGTLGRLWTDAKPVFTAESTGFEASLGNATPYGPFVQGDEQAKIHQGRWKKAERVLEDHKPIIEQNFQAAAERIAQKIEGTA